MATSLSSHEHPIIPTHRKRAHARAKRVAGILLFLSFSTFVWGWIYPRPYTLTVAVLVLLPWATVFITVLSHGFFRLDDEQRKTQNLAFALLMPGFALAIRAAEDFNLLAWKPALALSLGFGAVLWIAAAAANTISRKKRSPLIAMVLACVPYGYGASTVANALFDRSPATIYPTTVLHMHIWHHRRSSTTYDLKLAAWGQHPSSEVSVPEPFYDSLRIGGRVCVLARPGALHVPWYAVSDCGDSAESTIPKAYR